MTTPPPPATALALGLEPHPEGGWYRQTYVSPRTVGRPGSAEERPTATLIHFLLAPGERSAWHRVRSDEVWLWHRGGPLLLTTGGAAERPAPEDERRTAVLGPELAAGQVFQSLVPGGSWQCAEPAGAAEVLVSCLVTPGFDFADFTLLEQ